jgi:hypothetical protein
MATDVRADHNHKRAARWSARLIRWTGLLPMLVFASLLPIGGVAQETIPCPTGTPHWITAPSLPVRGPIVRSTPIPPGAMVPRPGVEYPQHEHLIGINIDRENFRMHRGPCAFRVNAAIQAHDDLFTGNQECDALIRQARAIQRRKEREDPCYANEARITSATPREVAPEDRIQLFIDGSLFMMPRGPCVRSVDIALMEHDDIFIGDPACDALIRRARAIQRRKEAEDPAYANEPRGTPAPGEDQ